MTLLDDAQTQQQGDTRQRESLAQRQPQQWQQQAGRQQQPQINVGQSERAISVAAGSILALLGLARRSIPGLIVGAVGGSLIQRGVTGHCSAYEAMGLDTTREDGQSTQDDIDERGLHVAISFTINRPAEQLYDFWHNFENLPRIMTHLESVQTQEGGRSHWVARAPGLANRRIEWDAQVTRDEPNSVIAWHSLPGADVVNAGEVRFSKALGDRGTEVRINMSYVPPAGRLGNFIAKMVGENPRRIIREDLRNFKRLMELGEILTIIGQSHGTCTGQGKRYSESAWRPLFT